jgi:hypothetical protein
VRVTFDQARRSIWKLGKASETWAAVSPERFGAAGAKAAAE